MVKQIELEVLALKRLHQSERQSEVHGPHCKPCHEGESSGEVEGSLYGSPRFTGVGFRIFLGISAEVIKND